MDLSNATASKTNVHVEKKQFKVLVIEDNPISQKVVNRILACLNCDVDIASNGKEALRLVCTTAYDLVFMDLGLPDMKGFTVAEKIRLMKDKARCQVPIVALTAHSDDDIRKKSRTFGINDYLVKPFTFENGKQILENLLHCAYTFQPEEAFQ